MRLGRVGLFLLFRLRFGHLVRALFNEPIHAPPEQIHAILDLGKRATPTSPAVVLT
jgi:hypothetical protein